MATLKYQTSQVNTSYKKLELTVDVTFMGKLQSQRQMCAMKDDIFQAFGTFGYTTVAFSIVLFPQLGATMMQHESGTEFPSTAKFLQSAELFTPQHFSCRATSTGVIPHGRHGGRICQRCAGALTSSCILSTAFLKSSVPFL